MRESDGRTQGLSVCYIKLGYNGAAVGEVAEAHKCTFWYIVMLSESRLVVICVCRVACITIHIPLYFYISILFIFIFPYTSIFRDGIFGAHMEEGNPICRISTREKVVLAQLSINEPVVHHHPFKHGPSSSIKVNR